MIQVLDAPDLDEVLPTGYTAGPCIWRVGGRLCTVTICRHDGQRRTIQFPAGTPRIDVEALAWDAIQAMEARA